MPSVAVILLPGILGSPLVGKRAGDVVWPVHDEVTLLGTVYGRSALEKAGSFADPIDGTSPGFNSRTALLPSPNTPFAESRTKNVAGLYHDFVTKTNDANVEKRGEGGESLSFTPDVYVLNYDWSRSTLDNVDAIWNGTSEILKNSLHKAFMYVAHSMGTLAALAQAIRLKQGSLPPHQAAFLGSVVVAGPIIGAPETLRRVVNGVAAAWYNPKEKLVAKLLAEEGWKCALLVPHIPGFSDLFWFDSGDDVASQVSKVMGYHFAESNPQWKWTFSGRVHCQSWSYGNQNIQALVKQMRRNIKKGRQLNTWIKSEHKDWTENTVAVALKGRQTLTKLSLKLDDIYVDPPVPTYALNEFGDGTVPLTSQTFGCAKWWVVPGGIDHGDALTDPRVWPSVYTAMNHLYGEGSSKGLIS
ncbi:hypothetical protein [Hyalangium versicolor]|uniref:hypothetical protein n=1 Tax=Hyalangium versicolor TaxID=2861190 RepID=UPI001CCB0C4A|nr:hypothetical protein [Hyalangium versicolor]